MYSRNFLLLHNEGHLVQGCIRASLSALKRSSNVERGPLYAALFTYSIGLERLLKISLILDHFVVSKGTFPTWKEIKDFGHDLCALHKTAMMACPRYKVEIPEACRTDDLDDSLLELSSEFAKQDRYFNLDALTGGGKSADPLPEWGRLLAQVYLRDIPSLKRISDAEQVEALANKMKSTTVYVPVTDFEGKAQSYEEFLADHGKITLVMPEVVWRFARILYPIQMLIYELQQPLRLGQGWNPEDFPCMWEICAFCSPDKKATLAEIDEY